MITALSLTIGGGWFACGRPPEAPSDLDALSHYLYREWDSEDPEVLAVGVANLIGILDRGGLSEDVALLDRSWEITAAREEDVAAVPRPIERDPADTLGVAVAGVSAWPVRDHARLQLESDQLPAEPTAKEYVRRFPDVDDPDCFLDEDRCDVLATVNDVRRENLLMSVEFTLLKNLRWVDLEDGGSAIVSRSSVGEVTVGEGGGSTIWQSFSLDVWMPAPRGRSAWRYQMLWSEADVAGASDAIQIGTVKSSTDDQFDAADEAIGELFH